MSLVQRLRQTLGLQSKSTPAGRARIIRSGPGFIRFAVHEVAPAPAPLPQVQEPAAIAARTCALADVMGRSHPMTAPLAWSVDGPLIELPADHALVGAVHAAFREHRPLVLTPDAVWLTLAGGLALHVEWNAEALRSRLVLHEGRQSLVIDGPEDGALDASGWADAVERWCALIRQRSAPEAVDLFLAEFSTTTPAARVAGQITLMSAFKRYFDYEMLMICGIPEIELRGTPEDWRRIRARVDGLSALGLERWCSRLAPVLDALVETSEGRPDLGFWSQIYIPMEVYGGALILGWVADLFPYVGVGPSGELRPNPLLDTPVGERAARLVGARAGRLAKDEDNAMRGLPLDAFPVSLSVAPVRQRWLDGRVRDLELVGGLMGVRQAGLDLEPVAGWAVREPHPLSVWIGRLQAEPGALPPTPNTRLFELPAELIRLMHEVGEVRLFDGAFTLLRGAGWRGGVRLGRDLGVYLAHLGDGRAIVAAPKGRGWHYLVGELILGQDPELLAEEQRHTFERADVVAEDLCALLAKVYASKGRL